MRREYQPASPGQVDEVRVVDRVSQYMLVSDAPEVAQKVAALWRQLPPGEQSRCHNPPFGLRFIAGGELILEASICWECDNIFGLQEDRDVHFAFNARALVSRELLDLLKGHFEALE